MNLGKNQKALLLWAFLVEMGPGAGLEPASRRSERRILPLDDPGIATDPLSPGSSWPGVSGLCPAIHVLLAATRLERRGCPRHERVHARFRRAMRGHDD